MSTCGLDYTNDIILRSSSDRKYIYIKVFVSEVLCSVSHVFVMYLQPRFYADVREGTIVYASIPVLFKSCSQQGSLSACLFKYDDPDAQCADGRTGEQNYTPYVQAAKAMSVYTQ